MAKTKITNQQLFAYHQELQKIGGTLLSLLIKSQINYFITRNGYKIDDLLSKITAMQKEYFIIENGQIKMSEPSQLIAVGKEPKPQQPQPEIQSGKNFEDFQKKWVELMNTEIEITV